MDVTCRLRDRLVRHTASQFVGNLVGLAAGYRGPGPGIRDRYLGQLLFSGELWAPHHLCDPHVSFEACSTCGLGD
jgi:hypothetical protein